VNIGYKLAPPVAPVPPWGSTTLSHQMPPPPIPRLGLVGAATGQGAHVVIPSPWSHSVATSNSQSIPSNGSIFASGTGYSQNHAAYALERQRWARASYSKSGIEIISLKITVVHEIPGKSATPIVAVSPYPHGLFVSRSHTQPRTLPKVYEM